MVALYDIPIKKEGVSKESVFGVVANYAERYILIINMNR